MSPSHKVPQWRLVVLSSSALNVVEGTRGFGSPTMHHAAGSASKNSACALSRGLRLRPGTERLRERDRRVDRLQAMLEGGPMRLKPVAAKLGQWAALDRRNHRLHMGAAASPYRHSPRPNSVPTPAKPRAAWAIAARARLQTTRSRNRNNPRPQIAVRRAQSTEHLEIALDKAQSPSSWKHCGAMILKRDQTPRPSACSGHAKQESAAGVSW